MATRTASASPTFLQRLPTGRWALVAGAFLLGWLLFAVVWLAARQDAAAPAGPVEPASKAETFEPLPRPMAAGDAATPLPAPREAEAPRLVEEAPPPAAEAAPPPVDNAPLPPSIETTAATGASVQPPAALADHAPAPRYPPTALRRGDSGTVVLQVEVDPEGTPTSVQVSGRSGSRDLDRAAVEAVSGWRFAPARDAAGNAVAGSLSIPIDFKLE